jgi:hypothetical protein
MISLYRQQNDVFQQLHRLISAENQSIQEGDTLTLAGLLQLEEELVQQIRVLNKNLVHIRQLLLANMPTRTLAMDQLACMTEPKVYITLKRVLHELKVTVFDIQLQKAQNIAVLEERMSLDRDVV